MAEDNYYRMAEDNYYQMAEDDRGRCSPCRGTAGESLSTLPPSPRPPSPPADATNPTIAPTTTPSITSSSPSPAWTTASPSRGVSVCLRYFAELSDYQRVFALSPSSRSHLELSGGRSYVLAFGGSYSPQNWFQSQRNRLSFSSFKPLWSRITPDFWTRVCVTVDTRRGVAQVFKNGFISIRKRLPWEYVWTGAPVIDISGFDGQVTDVQVWDFPLPYTEIFSYMNNGDFSPYRGNVITWSQVSYSARNNALLEDRYDWQLKRPIGGGDGRHGPMGEKMKFQNVHGKKERKRERMLM
ncbi:uncharacterized protein LOC115355639 [Myripristis murdjan]|uniref:uncharacterized protein LOC115355639 n=1 Tax=Myripristis murdjan TaxID=586833 RepID=UPI00117636D4|nr:uncharacterized protein LOC115355639 [Myripristis murdjan]